MTDVIVVQEPTTTLVSAGSEVTLVSVTSPQEVTLVSSTVAGASVISQVPDPLTIFVATPGAQGPKGDSAVEPADGKTLGYTEGLLTSLEVYSDSDKSVLLHTKSFFYVDSVLNYIETRNALDVLVSTRTMQYSSGVLVGVVDEAA